MRCDNIHKMRRAEAGALGRNLQLLLSLDHAAAHLPTLILRCQNYVAVAAETVTSLDVNKQWSMGGSGEGRRRAPRAM